MFLTIDYIDQLISEDSRRSRGESVIKRIVNDAKQYLYQYDPNFDFEDDDVKYKKEECKSNVNGIKKYYKTIDKIKHSVSYESDESPLLEFDDMPKDKRRSDEVAMSRKQICADLSMAKLETHEIKPAAMKIRPDYTLKEVCDNNGYQLSYRDFEDNKILLGNGSFGSVYFVC
jgi:hypothetical protein